MATLTQFTQTMETTPADSQARLLEIADFDTVVRSYQRRIYRTLLARLRDPDLADNLTQECFIRAYEKRASYRGESSLVVWLTRIAINLSLDHYRNRKANFWRNLIGLDDKEGDHCYSEVVAAHSSDPLASPERAAAVRQELDQVWKVVGKLSEKQRSVFLLHFVEGMTLQEVANVMGLHLGSIKTHLTRALKVVRGMNRAPGLVGQNES